MHIISAYPHDTTGQVAKREQGLSEFAKSVEGCDIRFNMTVYGGIWGEEFVAPSYADVKRFKIGKPHYSLPKTVSNTLADLLQDLISIRLQPL